MKCIGVIPSRYGSTRLPGKPLALIGEKPLIQHVWERASQSEKLDELLVATDDKRIADAVKEFGGNVVMTSIEAANGTERIAEALSGTDFDVVINIQGDEVFIDPSLIDELATVFEYDNVDIVTPIRIADRDEDISNNSTVKVVFDREYNAMYFSRSIIPYNRDNRRQDYWCHIGLYGYTKEFLFKYVKMDHSKLENSENLEQLRAIENGYKVRVLPTDYRSFSIDTPEDLASANEKLERMSL